MRETVWGNGDLEREVGARNEEYNLTIRGYDRKECVRHGRIEKRTRRYFVIACRLHTLNEIQTLVL